MPTVELSPGAVSSFYAYRASPPGNKAFFFDLYDSNPFFFNAAMVNNDSALYIFSTAAPVPSTWVPGATLATYTPLVSFVQASDASILSTSYNSTPAQGSLLTVSTTYRPATGTGTASWFVFGTFNGLATPYSQMIGTIGLPGSGADLIVGSLTVNAGVLYRATFSVQFPTSWSWT